MPAKRIIHVVTNVPKYEGSDRPTGLWLTELTHAWDVFAKKGYEQKLVSPKGGKVPLEPMSLMWVTNDASGKNWQADPAKMELLENTASPADIDPKEYDAIFLTGGHAVMYDFLDSKPLQDLIRAIWNQGGIVSSVCHGYCGLLNVELDDGSYLIANRKMTGFSWTEEIAAGVSSHVPYNAEELAKERGGLYEKGWIPFTSNVIVDGKLITGQNPNSAHGTAEAIVNALEPGA